MKRLGTGCLYWQVERLFSKPPGGTKNPPCFSRGSVSALEQAQAKYNEAIDDLNHHVTILTGVVSKQGWDIREIKSSLCAFEQSVNSRFDALDGRLGTLEQSVNSRFEAQDKKFDQILLLLNTLIPKPE